jgi:hypothetical protein
MTVTKIKDWSCLIWEALPQSTRTHIDPIDQRLPLQENLRTMNVSRKVYFFHMILIVPLFHAGRSGVSDY